MNIGDEIRTSRSEDFNAIIDYFNNFEINNELLQNQNLGFLRKIHEFSYNMNLFISKLEITEHCQPYLLQLKSNSIMLLNTCAFGDILGLKLNERLLIENFFRYIYYYHHEIEHHILQIEPSNFQTFTELFRYVKKYPKFRCSDELIHPSIDYLKNKHTELSKYIHTSTIEHMALVDDIISINRPMDNIEQEIRNFNGITQNIFFLMINFHLANYINLTLGEKLNISELLTDEQKRGISHLI